MPANKLRALVPTLTLGLAVALSVLPLGTPARQSSAQHSSGQAQSGAVPNATTKAEDLLAFREDWSSLSIDNSDLHAVAPSLGDKNDLPQNPFITERYRVQWRPEDPMDLYVIRPRNVKKPPVVLYLYSFPEDTERFTNSGWCLRVTSGGYAAIGFVSALTGHRYHDRPMKEWFVSELQESLGKSVHDVHMILNYLATRDDLDMSRVGMFGTGSGGSIAVLAAASDPRIKAIDLLDPWGDWPDWLAKSSVIHDEERSKFLKPEFLAGVAGLDPVKWLPQLKSQHIRIQYNEDDPAVPEAVQEAIEAAAPENAEINQFGDNKALGDAMGGGVLFGWIKGAVKSDEKAKAVAADQRVHVYPAAGGLIP